MTPQTNTESFGLPYIVKLFPNPAQQQLSIECYTSEREGNLSMLDRNGKLFKIISIAKNNPTIVSIEDFEIGVYLITLVIEGVTYDVKRVIISKLN